MANSDDNLDLRFTAELLTLLNQISVDMQAGKKVSEKKIDKYLADVRKEWRAKTVPPRT
jgi:hypothetical protein